MPVMFFFVLLTLLFFSIIDFIINLMLQAVDRESRTSPLEFSRSPGRIAFPLLLTQTQTALPYPK